MKAFLLLVVYAASVAAQALAPAPKTPADFPPETVVAVSGDRKITAAEVIKLFESLPLQMRQSYERDPKGFLSQWFLLNKLSAMAEEQKVDQRPPYKEMLAVQRMTMLAQSMMDVKAASVNIPQEDLQKAYEAKKDDYLMAKVKIIYVPFVAGEAQSVTAGQKTMTEAQALAKAEGVVKKARAGEDFVKLVAENSEDPISKERQGDFGPVRRGDKLPEQIKQSIFTLKPGEVTDPVRQPNGYYILRLQEMTPQPYDEVREVLYNEIKNARVKEWMDANVKSVEVKVENPEFFAPKKP